MLRLPPDLVSALDRFIAEERPGASRPEALRGAFRAWLTERGYLRREPAEGIPPDRLTSENDG
ncbi:ribbon-helix-helix domain-containing protein [Prosthecomicrobium pneumaticum]|uniref:Metal-responsive CopG/Arc/MetJ family transcriptional regulator n=1 Tax=Prosthecomicrobium pneumaticum TaxID=81895 RepID=A0A7W9FPW2_9HYPH|nr:ribbon-helix-helix domain-containing protein [Prosthecomicrobium pneumaticum]MBB5754634.1 metal-responsive CopG/Arc/MetJ family transcriptional regulator [Prosthecomicrobium pneumaticum]